VYLRLALPEALEADYERILYLDADIFVDSGDFSALLRRPILGRALAAVRDNCQWRSPSRRPRQFKAFGLPNAPYFNAGVMLIDVPAWRAQEVTERAVALGRRERERLIRHDQNLLNTVLHGDWTEMHPAWNWQFTRTSNLLAGMLCPNIIHFIGTRKPWNHREGRLPLRFARAFAAFDAAHFGADPAPDLGTPPQRNRAWLRESAWRHAFRMGALLDRLDRFEDDMHMLDPSGAGR
jgi:lipopolysaccharide biosynthesis glycosyltransferase